MIDGFDRAKSLQELEQDDWGEPAFDSHVVTTVHSLRRKPIADFTVEDLRIMIGQGVGLSFLIPLALERVEQEPLAEGDFNPGDLLEAVVQGGKAIWASRPDLLRRLHKVVRRVSELYMSLDESIRLTASRIKREIERQLVEASLSPTHKPKGPSSSNKRWLTEHLPQEQESWQMQFIDAGSLVGEERPLWLTCVTCPDRDSILAYSVSKKEPTSDSFWDTLVQAMTYPSSGEPRRPDRLQVRPDKRWRPLKPHLGEIGIDLTLTRELDGIDGLPELLDRVTLEWQEKQGKQEGGPSGEGR